MTTITAVRSGQVATFEAMDSIGYARRPVPGDGLIVETDTATIFIPVEEARRLMRELR